MTPTEQGQGNDRGHSKQGTAASAQSRARRGGVCVHLDGLGGGEAHEGEHHKRDAAMVQHVGKGLRTGQRKPCWEL